MELSNCIYVDGGCNKNTKGEAWGSVVNKDGIDLIGLYYSLLQDMILRYEDLPVGRRVVIIAKFDDVKSQQNNGAELLSMVAGLRIANYFYANNYPIPYILSDSQLLVEYWSKKITAGKSFSPLKEKYIRECIELRKIYERYGGSIVKISGNDNKADLGWHK